MRSQPFPLLGKYHFGWALFWISLMVLMISLMIGMNEAIRHFPFSFMTIFGSVAIFSGWLLGGGQLRTPIALLGGLITGLVLLVLINSGAYRNFVLMGVLAKIPYDEKVARKAF